MEGRAVPVGVTEVVSSRPACVEAVGVFVGGRVGALQLQLPSAALAGRSVGGGTQRRSDERPPLSPHRQQTRLAAAVSVHAGCHGDPSDQKSLTYPSAPQVSWTAAANYATCKTCGWRGWTSPTRLYASSVSRCLYCPAWTSATATISTTSRSTC